jgi:hypothetical protein
MKSAFSPSGLLRDQANLELRRKGVCWISRTHRTFPRALIDRYDRHGLVEENIDGEFSLV